MERAKLHFLSHHRHEVVRERVRAWQDADAIRAYCDAVEARHGPSTVAADAGASEWLAFARDRAERLQALPSVPADPKISAEALKPFLGGLSPYGPRGW
jgi:hypothetical protein